VRSDRSIAGQAQGPAEAEHVGAAARVVVQRELGREAGAAGRDLQRERQSGEAARGADLVAGAEALDRGGALREIDGGGQGGAGVGVREGGRPRASTAARRRETWGWCMAVTGGAKCRGERESGGGVMPRQRRAVAGAACLRRAKCSGRPKKSGREIGPDFLRPASRKSKCRALWAGTFRRAKNHLNGREMSRGAVEEFPRSPEKHLRRPRRPDWADPPDPTRNSARCERERVRPPERTPDRHPIRHPGSMETDTWRGMDSSEATMRTGLRPPRDARGRPARWRW
jgi:hypothetical protein